MEECGFAEPKLPRALPPITFSAKHLAVLGNGAPAFRPRRDMVGFHVLYLEVLTANLAYPLLPLVHLAPHVLVEGAYPEPVFIAVEHIPKYPFLVLYIRILHQSRHLRFYRIRIDGCGVILVVYRASIYTFHLAAVLDEGGLHPTNHLLKIVPQRPRIRVAQTVASHVVLYLIA